MGQTWACKRTLEAITAQPICSWISGLIRAWYSTTLLSPSGTPTSQHPFLYKDHGGPLGASLSPQDHPLPWGPRFQSSTPNFPKIQFLLLPPPTPHPSWKLCGKRLLHTSYPSPKAEVLPLTPHPTPYPTPLLGKLDQSLTSGSSFLPARPDQWFSLENFF